MNRFLLGGCLVVMLGCGARTDYFEDLDGAGGRAPGAGGVSGVAGRASSVAGGNAIGAGPSFGGAPQAAGAPSFGAAFPVAGAPSFGGAPPVSGGAPNFGGAPPVSGGAPNFGGAPQFAGGPGIGGSGATSGIVEACQVIAGNSCQQCLCESCSSQIVSCFSNFGCAVILACAQNSGCQGVACYTAQTCKPTIDQFGGLTGKAMANVFALLTCSAGSQNSCNCN